MTSQNYFTDEEVNRLEGKDLEWGLQAEAMLKLTWKQELGGDRFNRYIDRKGRVPSWSQDIKEH